MRESNTPAAVYILGAIIFLAFGGIFYAAGAYAYRKSGNWLLGCFVSLSLAALVTRFFISWGR